MEVVVEVKKQNCCKCITPFVFHFSPTLTSWCWCSHLFYYQFNNLMSVFHASVLLLIMNFVITLSKELWIRLLVIKISQWARQNLCCCRKNAYRAFIARKVEKCFVAVLKIICKHGPMICLKEWEIWLQRIINLVAQRPVDFCLDGLTFNELQKRAISHVFLHFRLISRAKLFRKWKWPNQLTA